MFLSKITHTCRATFTEVTKSSPFTYPFVAQTEFDTTIKYQPSNFDDTFKECLKETIAQKDAKFHAIFEKLLQTLSLHIKVDSTKFSFTLDDQDKKTSSFTESYNVLK